MAALATERWSERTYTYGTGAQRAYDVVGAKSEEEALAAVAQMGVSLNAEHPLDPNMHVKGDGLQVQQVSQNGVYKITAQYAYGAANDTKDPLNQPADFQWLPESVTEPVFEDVDGNPILNSAGEYPSTPPTRLVRRMGIVYGRNERQFPIAKYNTYQNAINSDTFMILGYVVQPGQAFMKAITMPTRTKVNARFTRVEYHVSLHPGFQKDSAGIWDGFRLRFADKGRTAWFKTDKGDKLLDIFLQGPNPSQVGNDVALDGTGGVFYPERYTGRGIASNTSPAPAKNPKPPKGAIITKGKGGVVLGYKNYKLVAFSSLNIFY